MPGRDGTGPSGAGMGQGRGGGRGMGKGRGLGRGAGIGGNCVCPACGTKAPHTPGCPCYSVKCSKCGRQMARE